MLIYVFLILIWYWLYKHRDGLSPLALCIRLSIPLLLVMGLRHVCVGSDTEQYLFRYEYSQLILEDDNYQWEKGYNYLTYLFHDVFNLHWQWFLFFTSAIYCVSLAMFISTYSNSPLLSFFLHLTIGMFVMSMSGIRQTMAVALCIISLLIITRKKNNNIRKFILAISLVLLAYSFHNSSWFFLPFLFMTNIRFGKSKAYLLLLGGSSALVLKNYLVPLVQPLMISKYSEMSLNTNYAANILVYVIPIAIGVFCLIFVKPDKDGKYDKDISLMFLFLSLTILFVSMKSLNNQIGRMAYYFNMSYLVLIPRAISSMNSRLRSYIVPILLVVCWAFFVIGNKGGIMQIDDYHFFWEKVIWVNRGDLLNY